MSDALLSEGSLCRPGERPFGVYLHVPYCRVRCGYCDFNTYTAEELGAGAAREDYADQVIAEIALASRRFAGSPPRVDTVFFGGGTPTLVPADDLVRILEALDATFGLAPGAEVTTEANPDSVDPGLLRTLRSGGFTRISFGVQSAVPHVLAVLDRTHDPARVPEAVGWARAAGFEQLSVDLIYGTPGESMADWEASLRHAISLDPDHVSAYALIVEPGTALARRVRRGEIVMPDDDETADKYLLADEALAVAGYDWYELSNWARSPGARCRHNELYWTGADWWGFGPGAHSHHEGLRWWNVKHPRAYAQRLAAGRLPVDGSERLDGPMRAVERVMLEIRLREGLPVAALDGAARGRVPDLVGRGLIERGPAMAPGDGPRLAASEAGSAVDPDARLVLTRSGRLLADAIVRELTP